MATSMMNAICKGAGRGTAAPAAADSRAANRYWPSTPMLNRFILKPIATARPATYRGTARFTMDASEFGWVP
jgi:hypothetical protein